MIDNATDAPAGGQPSEQAGPDATTDNDGVVEGDPITLLLIEDHAMVAAGLAAALGSAPDIDVVGTATSVSDGVDAARGHQPRVALVDFRLPDGTGAMATKAIHEVSPSTAVIIMTAHGGPEVLAQVIEAKCSAYLRKDQSLADLIDAVRSAARGETVFNRDMLSGLVERLRNPTPTPGSDLTVRELEVLRLLAQGLSASAIAEHLIVSRYTARNHIQNVLMKLGAHSRLEAVAIALREKIVTVDDDS